MYEMFFPLYLPKLMIDRPHCSVLVTPGGKGGRLEFGSGTSEEEGYGKFVALVA